MEIFFHRLRSELHRREKDRERKGVCVCEKCTNECTIPRYDVVQNLADPSTGGRKANESALQENKRNPTISLCPNQIAGLVDERE